MLILFIFLYFKLTFTINNYSERIIIFPNINLRKNLLYLNNLVFVISKYVIFVNFLYFWKRNMKKEKLNNKFKYIALLKIKKVYFFSTYFLYFRNKLFYFCICNKSLNFFSNLYLFSKANL